MRCCGLAPAAEEVDVRQSCWDPMEVPLKGSERRSCVPEEGSLQLWNLKHLWAARGSTPAVLVVSGFEDAFLSFVDTDLKGIVSYYISHLLVHVTYINIFKCLSQ